MAPILPSNVECFRRYMEVGQHGSREFIERLRDHAKVHGLLETGFEANLPIQFHELFWEMYLASALHRAGIDLRRGKSKAAEPDYFFRHENTTVFVEAVACGDPSDPANRVPPPPHEDNADFEDCCAPDGQIIQRLSQAIDYKIAAVTRPRAMEAMRLHGDYCVVIALNGCRALNGHPLNDIGVPFLPFVARAVFGAVEQRITLNRQSFWVCASRMNRAAGGTISFPVSHFDRPTWTTKDPKTGAMRSVSTSHIAGILYSQVSPEFTALPLGDDFVFVQNPYGPCATKLFQFCRGGVWARQGDRLNRL